MYQSFFTLAKSEQEGKDFRIILVQRDSAITIVAPHGGKIEPGTSQIAEALAGSDFSFYVFEGTKEALNFETLHITSDRFDEPQCVRLVGRSKMVVTVHGCKERDLVIRVGGRDEMLKSLITERLRRIRVRAEAGAPGQAGAHANNICNRGLSGKGIQLEISAGLRQVLLGFSEGNSDEGIQLFHDVVNAVREVLVETERRER